MKEGFYHAAYVELCHAKFKLKRDLTILLR